MSEEPPVDFIERQDWLQPVEDGAQKAVAAAFNAAGPASQPLRNALHGTWLGHPLHPVLTDIPIGAWTATFVLDLMDASGRRDCRAGADVALAVGLTGAGCAALAGITDWHVTDGRARRVGIVHGIINLASAALYTASLIARRRRDRSAGRTLAFAGFMAAFASAYLGGNLVYGKQIGVNHALGDDDVPDWTAVAKASDLHEDQPHRASARGVRLLLVRSGGRVHCLSEVCSHLGGPLADGEIRDETVTCPWHGSRFSLADGSVIDGPATHPQPCFETRIQNDEVQVRSRRQE